MSSNNSAPAAARAVAIGIGRAGIASARMPAAARRLDAGHRILDDDAVEGLHIHGDGGMKEEIGKRFSARHLAAS